MPPHNCKFKDRKKARVIWVELNGAQQPPSTEGFAFGSPVLSGSKEKLRRIDRDHRLTLEKRQRTFYPSEPDAQVRFEELTSHPGDAAEALRAANFAARRYERTGVQ
jgi:hypothetical protein